MGDEVKSLDELDRLCAEKVMGWFYVGILIVNSRKSYQTSDGSVIDFSDWQPTRNIAQAWECLEKISAGYVIRKGPLLYRCLLAKADSYEGEEDLGTYEGKADFAPLAIVLACLKAVGCEVD